MLIVSDRDPRFTSNFCAEFCRLTGTKQNMSISYHSESNGWTERVNRVLEDVLRHASPLYNDWDEFLMLWSLLTITHGTSLFRRALL